MQESRRTTNQAQLSTAKHRHTRKSPASSPPMPNTCPNHQTSLSTDATSTGLRDIIQDIIYITCVLQAHTGDLNRSQERHRHLDPPQPQHNRCPGSTPNFHHSNLHSDSGSCPFSNSKGEPSRLPATFSAMQRAIASTVTIGFTPVAVGKTDASHTHKPCTSHDCPCVSTADVRGSSPIRADPICTSTNSNHVCTDSSCKT